MQKVAMYIDGFNFYYSIKHNKQIPVGLGWCDFRKLAEQHMIPLDSKLQSIKYFTAPVKWHGYPGEEENQNLWLQAVQTISGLTVIPGFHIKPPLKSREEKQTDVNIAVELLLDAMDPNGYDMAILVTGDLDLVPAVIAVQERIKQPRKVAVWIPQLLNYATWKRDVSLQHNISCELIKPEMLKTSRLPDVIPTAKESITCPVKWRMA